MSITLAYDAFIRAIRQSTDTDHAFLLGAGASISSGVQPASDCIWEWKRDIFISKNAHLSRQFQEYKSDSVRKRIQEWLDNEGVYPSSDDPDEYSKFAELAYPIPDIRRKYFQKISSDKDPSIGYKILCLMAKEGMARSIFTTNFDGLVVKSAHQMSITPVEVSLDTAERVYRTTDRSELLCVELHGDYKYGPLKNTNQELDSQHDAFIDALAHHLKTKHLIVMGYSGRDNSLMDALEKAYVKGGAGILFWCGYGHEIPEEVKRLIESVRTAGRSAYYVPTDGFDNTMIHLAKNCFEDSESFQTELDKLLQNGSPGDFVRTPFSMDVPHLNNILSSNLLPVSCPKEIFQFEIRFDEGEKAWRTIRELTDDTNVIAAPLKKMVYAFGTLSEIHSVFSGRITSEIKRTPVTLHELRTGNIISNLFIKALTRGLAQLLGLKQTGENKLWDNSVSQFIKVGIEAFKVHAAVKLSFFFDNKYAFLSLKPSYHVDTSVDVTKETNIEIAREYYSSLLKHQPNIKFHDFLYSWRQRIFNGANRLDFEYPINTGSGFSFKISANTMHVGIMRARSNRGLTSIPSSINRKSILHEGIQYLEPKLDFLSAHADQVLQDFHPMRGLIKNRPYDYLLNGNVFEPEVNLGVIAPVQFGDKLFDFLNKLNRSHSAGGMNPDYLLDYPGFLSAYKIPLNIPDIHSKRWRDCQIKMDGNSRKAIGLDLLTSIKKHLDLLDNSKRLVIVILIPDSWLPYTRIDDEFEKFDLHDQVKAYAAQKGIATQFIQENTLSDSLICQINWWLSLSFYVKSLRTPWILSGLDSSSAFVGIGYSVDSSKQRGKIVVGCSHIYSSTGEGLKYKLSKVDDFQLDRRNNPFLSYHEAYKFGTSIREMFFSTKGELPKRVVVHKRTPFKGEETRGIIDSLKKSGIEEVNLVEISFESSACFLALKIKYGVSPHPFPVSRGSCFLINSYTALLYTHGIVPSVKEDFRSYYLGGKNIPVPVKIKKHYGTSNISTIATEILGLTKMNWNSFDLYSKLPATIESSNEIARIGWLLSRFEGQTYDYRNFM